MTKATQKKKATIDPSEWYSLSDIVQSRMFPWAISFWGVRNIIKNDRTNILKAMITGTGRGTKYRFQGKNIINFIKSVEDGTVRI